MNKTNTSLFKTDFFAFNKTMHGVIVLKARDAFQSSMYVTLNFPYQIFKQYFTLPV